MERGANRALHAPRSPAPRSTLHAPTSIAAVHGSYVVAGLGLYLTAASALALGAELGLAGWQLGLLFSAYSFGYGTVGPFAGALAARLGPTNVLAGAMALFSALAASFSLTADFGLLVALRFLMGLCGGTVSPVGTLLLASTVAPSRLPLAIGLALAGFGVGALLPFGVFVPLLGPAEWRGHARAAALLAGLAVLLLVLIGRARAGQQVMARGGPALALASFKAVLGAPGMRPMTLYNACLLIPLLSVVAWAPVYLQRALGTSASMAGPITSAAGLGMALTPLLTGWLMLRVPPERVLVLASFSYILLPLSMTVAGSELMVLALVFLSGCGPRFGFSAVLATAPRLVPIRLTGLAVGVINIVSFALSLFPPVLFGLVLDRTGSFALAFLALAACAAPGPFLAVRVLRRGRVRG